MISWKRTVEATASEINKKKRYVEIVIKHFFNGYKQLLKEYKYFREKSMYSSTVKKRIKNRNK